MAKKYDSDMINQINNSISLLDYVSQYAVLEQRNGEWWAKCPLHKDDINPSFSINVEKNMFYCLGCNSGGTPVIFAQLFHKFSFPQAIEHLIKYADVEITPREYSDLLDYLHKYKFTKKEKKIITRNYLPNNTMLQYSKEPIAEWIAEGIDQKIMDEYDVRYDKYANRIVYPIRDEKGIISVKGRTLYPNFQELGLRKYSYYQEIGTNDFLFGLYKNTQHIKEKKEVLVFESSKAVMLAEGYGYKNAVSLETSSINKYQMDLLLNLKCDIVLCLDKGIKITTKKATGKYQNNYVDIGLLSKFTNVYVVEDKKGLLKDKASPVDQGIETWQQLYDERCKI